MIALGFHSGYDFGVDSECDSTSERNDVDSDSACGVGSISGIDSDADSGSGRGSEFDSGSKPCCS